MSCVDTNFNLFFELEKKYAFNEKKKSTNNKSEYVYE